MALERGRSPEYATFEEYQQERHDEVAERLEMELDAAEDIGDMADRLSHYKNNIVGSKHTYTPVEISRFMTTVAWRGLNATEKVKQMTNSLKLRDRMWGFIERDQLAPLDVNDPEVLQELTERIKASKNIVEFKSAFLPRAGVLLTDGTPFSVLEFNHATQYAIDHYGEAGAFKFFPEDYDIRGTATAVIGGYVFDRRGK